MGIPMTKRDSSQPANAPDRRFYEAVQSFVTRWHKYMGTELAGGQSFLNDLLAAYGANFKAGTIFEQHPVRLPVRNAKTGQQPGQQRLFGEDAEVAYTTDRIDMYLPRICIWEMKSPHEKDLQKHHPQILEYWSRMRPRYLVLCNFHEIWVYDTNEPDGQLVPQLRIPIDELPGRADALLFLRGETPDLQARAERVTAEVAGMLGRLVREKTAKSKQPITDGPRIARVVLECVFAMFAEDTDLIPAGIYTDQLDAARKQGDMQPVWRLFDDFARRVASERSHRFAPYVNGALFDLGQSRIDLAPGEIEALFHAARDFDWNDVRPEIFGTIFEQAFTADDRHQLGAHYTRETDILRVVGPTVIEPWRQRIDDAVWPKDVSAIIEDMKVFHVLDPACGCGDFLYVVYREMKRLESALKQKWYIIQKYKVAKRKADIAPPPEGPYFSLAQLHGIELNGFAAFLARVVLWIGEHLAARELGLDEQTLPLKNLDETVCQGDALLVDWPRPEGRLAIVGNPPYLGVRKMRHELGDSYVDALSKRYPDHRAADYVTYWFGRALEVLRPGERAGFVATKSVGQNESREASLDRIVAKGGTIVDAWSNWPWPGEAAVHFGIVNWIMEKWEGIKRLDGEEVPAISTTLTSLTDVTAARHLEANENLCFMGVTPGNSGFVLTDEERAAILAEDKKSDAVIKPFLIGRDVNREVGQKPARWIIDFGMMEKEEAETFPGAMRHVRKHVYAAKKGKADRKTDKEKARWWQFVRPRPDLRSAIEGKNRVLVIPAVSPHLIISRQPATTCFDHQLMVLALSRPYHFGILQSSVHSTWAWHRGSTLKGDLRYTNTTIFETFPFPLAEAGYYNPRVVPATPAAEKVAEAGEEFERVRNDACREQRLGLTKIHNLLEADKMPALEKAYAALNDAVCECYGWPKTTWRNETETLERLLEVNFKMAPGV